VRELRFDEALWLGPGLEVDFCRRVRAAGRRVRVEDLALVQHRALDLVRDPEVWMLGHLQHGQRLAEQAGDVDWEARALAAEADHEAARTIGYFNKLVTDRMVEDLEARLAALSGSPGWRATRPLRELNRWRRGR
jgi:hypothetical protein